MGLLAGFVLDLFRLIAIASAPWEEVAPRKFASRPNALYRHHPEFAFVQLLD